MNDILNVDLGTAKFSVMQDDDSLNPLTEFDNLGTMVCWHRRHSLGNKHSFSSPAAFQEEVNDKNAIILPLYLYDHSGITMRTYSFSCPWDSGQVGFIYVLKSKVREEYKVKRITAKVRAKVEACLQSEVKTYDQYLTGDVYGFVLEDAEGNHLDSCWGFYGMESIKSGVQDMIPAQYREQILAAL